MSKSSTLPTRITALGRDLRERRSIREAHRDLAREIAAFNSPADLLEMHAILDRQSSQDSEQVGEIRQILFELSVAS